MDGGESILFDNDVWGQGYEKMASFPKFGFRPDRAAIVFNDLFANGQAQTGSEFGCPQSVACSGDVVLIEYFWKVVFIYSDAFIVNGNLDAFFISLGF